jgi:hypothetical protein
MLGKHNNLNYTVNYCTHFRGLTNKGNLAGTKRFSEREWKPMYKLSMVRLTNP